MVSCRLQYKMSIKLQSPSVIITGTTVEEPAAEERREKQAEEAEGAVNGALVLGAPLPPVVLRRRWGRVVYGTRWLPCHVLWCGLSWWLRSYDDVLGTLLLCWSCLNSCICETKATTRIAAHWNLAIMQFRREVQGEYRGAQCVGVHLDIMARHSLYNCCVYIWMLMHTPAILYSDAPLRSV